MNASTTTRPVHKSHLIHLSRPSGSAIIRTCQLLHSGVTNASTFVAFALHHPANHTARRAQARRTGLAYAPSCVRPHANIDPLPTLARFRGCKLADGSQFPYQQHTITSDDPSLVSHGTPWLGLDMRKPYTKPSYATAHNHQHGIRPVSAFCASVPRPQPLMYGKCYLVEE